LPHTFFGLYVGIVMERPPFFDTHGGGLWLTQLDVDLDLQ
jgi:hypothetical protein